MRSYFSLIKQSRFACRFHQHSIQLNTHENESINSNDRLLVDINITIEYRANISIIINTYSVVLTQF